MRKLRIALFAFAAMGCNSHPGASPVGTGSNPNLGSASGAIDPKKAQEIAQIIQSPSAFLQPSSMGTDEKGTGKHHDQLVRIAVLNRSDFALSNIQGSAQWLDSSGSFVGSTTFNLAGVLPAGSTKIYLTADRSMTSTTLEGPGATMRVTFTHADVIE
jgi:hypothetical protein